MNTLSRYNMDMRCKQLASLAVQALLEEAVLYPKPGLVDPVSTGAHTDMDITTFMRSIAVLSFGFYDYARIGSGLLPSEQATYSGSTEAAALRCCLRAVGLALEQAMFAATGGINTHKGAIFLFGYLLAAAGRIYRRQLPLDEPADETPDGIGLVSAELGGRTIQTLPLTEDGISAADFFSELRFLAAGLFEEDTAHAEVKKQPTHGEQMFLRYGCKGIRGAVEAGLPLVERNVSYLTALDKIPQREAV